VIEFSCKPRTIVELKKSTCIATISLYDGQRVHSSTTENDNLPRELSRPNLQCHVDLPLAIHETLKKAYSLYTRDKQANDGCEADIYCCTDEV